jgi:hypothetical protein
VGRRNRQRANPGHQEDPGPPQAPRQPLLERFAGPIDQPLISPEFVGRGPNVIGATGGSGTRAFAQVARRAGMFIGRDPSPSEDALEFGEYSDCWINAFLMHRDSALTEEQAEIMRNDLRNLLRRHLDGLEGRPEPWGWKEPRSIYLLPFFDASLPSMRFLHVVRDGRDMALSENQNQLRKHGGAYLGRPTSPTSPVDSIALWSSLNVETARYGEERLGERYLRLRFEDLCRDPVATSAQILAFFGLRGDPEEAAAEVHAPETLERWRRLDPSLLSELEHAAGPALSRFGYVLSDQLV